MKWIENLVIMALAVIAPVKTMMITVAVLLIVDLVTGIWAAMKRKEKFSSARLRDTVSKLVIYELAIISGFLVERFLLDGGFAISKMAAGLIGMVEITSVYENLNSISGNDFLKDLIKRIGSKNNTPPNPPE